MASMRGNRRAAGTVAAVAACCLGLVAGAIPAVGIGRGATPAVPAGPGCAVRLDVAGPTGGGRALAALSEDLTAVANRHGWSADRLRSELRRDPSLRVSPCGDLLYVDPPRPTTAATPGGTAPAGTAPGGTVSSARVSAGSGDLAAADVSPAGTPGPADAFTLHSNPGASRVLLLDFDGMVLDQQTNAWAYWAQQSWTARPYDSDGDDGSVSQAERETIVSIWQRVAEDFAPFDIDVTTQDPGDAALERSGPEDTAYGSRVLITADEVVFTQQCGRQCGGIAAIGVYGEPAYQPAWVFTAGLGTGAKNLAEAASHEAGHNLGLRHDGRTTPTGTLAYYTGHTPWAPIMGVGYGQPVVQWSRGEYAGANNPEDDLALIASTANGIAMRPDEAPSHGIPGAPVLSGGAPVEGVISQAADADSYLVDVPTAGTVTLGAVPAPISPNLDIALTLRDSEGSVVAQADPSSSRTSLDVASGLAATISQTLPAGTYVATVDGAGLGVPATGYGEYGSLGSYVLTATLPSPDGAPGTGDPPASDPPVADPPPSVPPSDPPASVPPSDPPASDPPASDPPASNPAVTDPPTANPPPSNPPSGPPSGPPASDPPATQPPADPATTPPGPGTDDPGSTGTPTGPSTGTPTGTSSGPSAGPSSSPTLQTVAVRSAYVRAGRRLRLRLAATGGVAPYHWTIAQVAAHTAWLQVTPSGFLSGRTQRAGRYRVVVALTDAAGGQATTTVRVRVRTA